jgi:hypothetical protein
MKTGYIYDPEIRASTNRQGQNYWYEYIKEMNEQMGLRAEEMPISSLGDTEYLEGLEVLIIGDLTPGQLPSEAESTLDAWVRQGGILIGFGTEGLDAVFGNNCSSVIEQRPDDYTISGYFDLLPDPLTAEVHSYLHPSQKLLILSNIRRIEPKQSKTLSRLYELPSNAHIDTGCAAITKRDHGLGHAYYFSFNVPKTIWLLHQGRPVTSDRDGDGYYRASDLRVIGENHPEVLYADEILFLLQNMIGHKPQPFIYQMPPRRGTLPRARTEGAGEIPDALVYWGGDDEGLSGAQLWSSNWMKSRGLPYHINVMYRDGSFNLTREEAAAITANGHEYSLHYNFLDGYTHPLVLSESDIEKQAAAFYRTFGRHPICSVNHWTFWTGWVEPAKWMMNAGGRADNSFIHRGSPPLNPVNLMGFSFGTSYPFYFYDDYGGDNARLNFLEEPITAYEVGYEGKDVEDFGMVHRVVDMAAKYHLLMDMFYHPPNIFSSSVCRAAVDEVLRYIDERGIRALHMGNDELCIWWEKRANSDITEVLVDPQFLSFITRCEYSDGMIAKVPLRSSTAVSVTCDGSDAVWETRNEFGGNWTYIVCPAGEHRIEVRLA